MKKILFSLISLIFVIGFTSCHEEEPDDTTIWEYYPFAFRIYVHDREGKNLLDPSNDGNILDKEIYLIYKGEKIDAVIGRPEANLSRAVPTEWYGIFIAQAFKEYEPELGNSIFVGQFYGGNNKGEFELVICDNSYDFKFESIIQKDHQVKREFKMNGFNMYGTTYYFTYDKDLKDVNYFKK